MDSSSQNNNEKPKNILRCINIDCVFNSANDPGHKRNICNHPNVYVEAKFADITIAICSEFRSKKDYRFDPPSVLTDLKTGGKSEISGIPDLTKAPVEKITTTELEEGLTTKEEDIAKEVITETTVTPVENVKPVIVETSTLSTEELSPSEIYNLTDRPGSDFLILKKLYQPNMKKGMVFSVICHVFLIILVYLFTAPKEENHDQSQNQRIVVVEDIETPKFDPPDVDKLKEDELKLKEDEDKVKENTQNVRPKITPKNIKPKINRPRDKSSIDSVPMTNVLSDSLKHIADSLLAIKNKLDTNRFTLPDSLKNIYSENAIGMSLWFPKNWKLTDNRSVDLNKEQFNGVIINTDSLSEDPGAVSIFVLIDDPDHTKFIKSTFKNPFLMEDSTRSAFSTDPVTTGGKRISYKFFIFSDDLGKKNIYVNVEAVKDHFDKYKPIIDAIVRSIKIVVPPPAGEKKGP